MDRRLDRLKQFDERSRGFVAVEGIETKPFRSYTWSCDAYNDQGSEGACVGFAWSHELAARPKVIPTDATTALKIYARAKALDPWPGEDYSGTSVLAGIKALQEYSNSKGLPYIQEYRWAFGIQDVMRVIGYRGPVVLGINWYENMYEPDENNMIYADGEMVGGHAILANGIKIVKLDPATPYPVGDYAGIDIDKSLIRLHNSWGTSYGLGGDAFISVRHLDALLKEDGEACIPMRRTAA